MDTYTAADVLVDFTVDKEPSSFNNNSISEFLAALQEAAQNKMPGAEFRLVYINNLEATTEGLVDGDIASFGG